MVHHKDVHSVPTKQHEDTTYSDNHNSNNKMPPPKGGEDNSGSQFQDVELTNSTDPQKSPLLGNNNRPSRNVSALPSHHQHEYSSPWWSATAHGKAISACLLYSFCSVSMVLTNKSLASSYQQETAVDLNILVVVFQAIVAVFCVEFSKRMGWIEIPELTTETIKLWIPVNLFFCGMLFTGMASLQHNSVPMVTIFKNITNIMVASGDFFFFGQSVEMLIVASFGVTLAGAVAAGWTDISSTWIGLFWMAMNCVSTAGYVLYMKFATQHVKLSKFGMVFVNNILCSLFLFPAALARGELQAFLATPSIHTFDYFGKNCVGGFMGFFLNFAALNCVSATGPTTYAVVGSLNKVPVALLGYLMFDGAITTKTWFFIWVSLCGGFLYSYAKIRASTTGKTRNENESK